MLAQMVLKSGLAVGSSAQHGITTESNLRPHNFCYVTYKQRILHAQRRRRRDSSTVAVSTPATQDGEHLHKGV